MIRKEKRKCKGKISQENVRGKSVNFKSGGFNAFKVLCHLVGLCHGLFQNKIDRGLRTWNSHWYFWKWSIQKEENF